MKALLKRVLPPAVARYMREYANTRTYPSWQAAVAAAGVTYSDDFLSGFRAARARLNRGNYRTVSPGLEECVALFGPQLAISDFGGATGEFGEALIRRYPAIRYVVIESPSMVAAMEGAGNGVSFTSRMPDHCDVFFTSCTIPYIESPMEVLEAGFRSATKACVVARNCFADTEIFRVQNSLLFNNGSGQVPDGYENRTIRYAHRTAREQEIVALGERTGFRLLKRLEDNSGIIPYKKRAYGGTLIFVAREA